MSWVPHGEAKQYATDCGAAMGYFQRYQVAVAAALWCAVPPDQVPDVLAASDQVARAIWRSPTVPCLEPKCRAIHEAIDTGQLPVYREQGGACKDQVAPDRRHVSRSELRAWIAEHYPEQKPPFLFDETERATHSAINVASFRALQIDRDAAQAELEKAKARANEIAAELNTLRGERDSLRAIVDKKGAPSERSETTYLNIIGGLLGLLLGNTPAGKPQSVYESQAAVISALLAHHDGKPGISTRTLEEKFSAAKRSLVGS